MGTKYTLEEAIKKGNEIVMKHANDLKEELLRCKKIFINK